jgi:CRISPR-associated protein (TIGR03986 family)
MKMKYVKAPYNFVPLNKQVVYPHWGNHISHDLPFKDGLSGELELTIDAKSPLFISDSEVKNSEENQNKEAKKFFNVNGHYMIPGSSIKGMLRSVLEILTFSQMGNKVNTHRYAVRDLSQGGDFYKEEVTKNTTYCGWLSIEDGEYKLNDCGKPGRISHEEIDRFYKTNFKSLFSDSRTFKNKNVKSGVFKYSQFYGKSLSNSFHKKEHTENEFVINDKRGKKGTIIFTGQPGPRKEKQGDNDASGKYLEFIFFEKKEEELKTISKQVVKEFNFAYLNHEAKKKQSIDWKEHKKTLLKGGKIPVFFQTNGDGEVKHMGISYMYKLPYNYSVDKSINNYQNHQNNPDFSETLFGTVESTSFKSRVHIGHAWADMNTVIEMPEVKDILSGPKASYYPNYIRQSVGKYRTFMDEGSVVSGWKRYPVHKLGVKTRKEVRDNENDDVKTNFIPLQTGATFQFKLRYHNLRPIELGALVSAITFHNKDGHFHSIGSGKPLGYGKIEVNLKHKDHFIDYLKDFEAYMNASLKFKSAKWHEQEQIIDLLAMSREQDNKDESALDYMKLKNQNKKNEYVFAKNQKEFLKRYSNLENIKSGAGNTLCTSQDIQKMGLIIAKESNRFHADRSLAEQIDNYKATSEIEAQELLTKIKEELKTKLKELQKTELTKIKEKFDELRSKITKDQGIEEKIADLKSVNVKKVFGMLNSRVISYCSALHSLNENKLKEKFGQSGYLPKKDHEAVVNILEVVIPKMSKNDRKKWENHFDKNADLRKVAQWIGVDKAKEWHNDFFKKA